jgi:hypothetical protein
MTSITFLGRVFADARPAIAPDAARARITATSGVAIFLNIVFSLSLQVDWFFGLDSHDEFVNTRGDQDDPVFDLQHKNYSKDQYMLCLWIYLLKALSVY